MLTNNLPAVLPDLSTIIRTRLERLHETHPKINGEANTECHLNRQVTDVLPLGVTQSPVYVMIVKLVVLSNAVSFFGKDLGMASPYHHLAHPAKRIPVSRLTIIIQPRTKPSWSRHLRTSRRHSSAPKLFAYFQNSCHREFLSPFEPASAETTDLKTSRILGQLMRRRLKSQDFVYSTLLAVTEQRCLERDMKNLGQDVPYHVCVSLTPFRAWADKTVQTF